MPEAPTRAILMLASCQYPPDLLREGPAYRSLARMRARLRTLAAGPDAGPRALWMAGDTIYVDPTAGLFDPEHPLDRYDAPYRFLRGRIWQRLEDELDHVFCLADDHEYQENWEPSARPRVQRDLETALIHGKRAHLRHMHGDERDLTDEQVRCTRLWGERARFAGMPVFVLDLRTEREHRSATTVARARMVSDAQMQAFTEWLKEVRQEDEAKPGRAPVPKLVLSASTLLPRRLVVAEAGHVAAALYSDACDGFPRFMAETFGAIAEIGVRGLLFLSGDEHLSFVTRAELTARGRAPVVIHSVHASPLYGPYPFANGRAEAFVEEDAFETVGGEGSEPVRVRASTRFLGVGNGFCELGFGTQTVSGGVGISISGERSIHCIWYGDDG